MALGRHLLVLELSKEGKDAFVIDEKAVLVPRNDVGQAICCSANKENRSEQGKESLEGTHLIHDCNLTEGLY
jgi:hypothetical protein